MQSSVERAVEQSGASPSPSELLAMMPYGKEFLFIDEFLEADPLHVVARYRFRGDEFFYPHHFPDRAVTPGVLLLEAMCQSGMVAQGLYLLAREKSIEHARQHRFLVTSAEVEWLQQVRPGERVTIQSQLLSWRLRRIHTSVKMFGRGDAFLAEAKIAGLGVLWNPDNSRISSANGTTAEYPQTKSR